MIQKSFEFWVLLFIFFLSFFFQIQESGTNGFNGSKSNENILNNNATKHTPNNIVKQKKPTTPTPTVTSTKADTKSRR